MVTRKMWFDPSELMLPPIKWNQLIFDLRKEHLIHWDLCAWLDAVDLIWDRVKLGFAPHEGEWDERQRAGVDKLQVAFRYAHYMGWVQHHDFIAEKQAKKED